DIVSELSENKHFAAEKKPPWEERVRGRPKRPGNNKPQRGNHSDDLRTDEETRVPNHDPVFRRYPVATPGRKPRAAAERLQSMSTSSVAISRASREASHMGPFALTRYPLAGIATIALLTACGGPQPLVAAPPMMFQTAKSTAHLRPSASWML